LENNQEKLRQHLVQLRKELVEHKLLLHESNSTIREMIKGFKTISETGNVRVADVFLEEFNEE